MTLIEIVVCLTLLSVVFFPVMNLFTNSAKISTVNREKIDVTYLAQSTIEELRVLNYSGIIARQVPLSSDLSVARSNIKITPSGKHEDVVGSGKSFDYVHLIYLANKIFVVMPDGNNGIFDASDIKIIKTGSKFKILFTDSSHTKIESPTSADETIVIVNTVKIEDAVKNDYDVDKDVHIVTYNSSSTSTLLTFDGQGSITNYINNTGFDGSLIKIKVDIYKENSAEVSYSVEEFLNVINE